MKTNEVPKKKTRVKFDKTNEEQIELGVKVLVASYNSSCKRKEDAVKRAMNKLTDRDSPKLPKIDSFVGYLTDLKKAIAEQRSPAAGRCAWTIVVKRAYDELTGHQVSVNDIQGEKPADDPTYNVPVTHVDAQEDQMEKDAEVARAEEPIDELPFDDPPFPEEFDILQSDVYMFLTGWCRSFSWKDGVYTIEIEQESLEKRFKRRA